LRAVGCVLISDNVLVNELRECRVGSTESRLGFSHEDAIPVYCNKNPQTPCWSMTNALVPEFLQEDS
jgi:hypothetical protein